MSDYTAYVAGAYAIAGGTVAALVLWAFLERRWAKRALERAQRAAERLERRQ